jgi:cell division protein FtsB
MSRAIASPQRQRPRAAARPSTRRRSAPTTLVGSAARVRWDRLARLAMLCVLVALAYLYLSAGIHVFQTWSQERSHGAAVTALQREHTLLVREHEALGRRGTLEAEARRLGMVKSGEQPYILSGLPNN